jgi:hypothetical protein
MERIGAEMLEKDSLLNEEFSKRVKTDSTFAASPGARLSWLYRHSAWADPLLNVYPVGRVIDKQALDLCYRYAQKAEARGKE